MASETSPISHNLTCGAAGELIRSQVFTPEATVLIPLWKGELVTDEIDVLIQVTVPNQTSCHACKKVCSMSVFSSHKIARK
jgi:hypothetical protein